MIGKMLAATAALFLVIGLSAAADEKKADADQVSGKFIRYDAEKNEITIKVNKDEMTYPLAKDAKVSVGEVKDMKDLSKIKADQMITLTLKTEGKKSWVTDVRESKAKEPKDRN